MTSQTSGGSTVTADAIPAPRAIAARSVPVAVALTTEPLPVVR